jgi:hypothetical protein
MVALWLARSTDCAAQWVYAGATGKYAFRARLTLTIHNSYVAMREVWISWRNGFTAVRKVRSESCNPPRSSRRICSDLCTSTAALRYLTLSRPNGANERR